MPEKSALARRALCIVVAVVLSGCAAAGHKKESLPQDDLAIISKTHLLNPYPNLTPSQFQGEIARLEKIALQNNDPLIRARAHLRMGVLHLDSRNPNPNYLLALREFDLYLAYSNDTEEKKQVKNLVQPLLELKKVMEENKRLRTRLDHAMQENQEIKRTVEQLKNLDLKMEERRRQVK